MKSLPIYICCLLFVSFFMTCEKVDLGIEENSQEFTEEVISNDNGIFSNLKAGNNFTIETNESYDVYDRTKFDIAMPNSSTPTGLVIYIHGGGFTSGDKSSAYKVSDALHFLDNNIAVASIGYRLLENAGNETVGVLKCLNDSRRALQYIRNNAATYNIDKDDIVLVGNSAGAGTALWIATRDDMQDSSNADPVLRESTRVKGAAAIQTQCSYNIEDVWIDDVFADYGLTWNELANISIETVGQFYAVSSINEYNTPAIDAYRADVDMMAQLTSDDPEIYVENVNTDVVLPTDLGVAYHHAFHARTVKERADAVGVPNVAYYGKDPIIFSDPSGESFRDFVKRKINE